MGFYPAKFGLPRPFPSRVMLRHATDGQTDRRTDRRTDRQTDSAQSVMPLPIGRGIITNAKKHSLSRSHFCAALNRLPVRLNFQKYFNVFPTIIFRRNISELLDIVWVRPIDMYILPLELRLPNLYILSLAPPLAKNLYSYRSFSALSVHTPYAI